jgi:hypothetical protein
LRDTRSRDELDSAVAAVVNAFKSLSTGSSSGSPGALSGALEQWLEVAEKRRDPSGSWLIERVGSKVAAGNMTEARDYVAAATALGDVLGDPLSSAARRAQWRIDRGYREAQDNRQLEHYHQRPEFEAALEELVWGPSTETWALHLLGNGGVGKTTLVRYLSSGRFAAERGKSPLPVARVDFDHLDPRYPEQRPAELLMALVGDLSGFTLSRSAYAAMRPGHFVRRLTLSRATCASCRVRSYWCWIRARN